MSLTLGFSMPTLSGLIRSLDGAGARLTSALRQKMEKAVLVVAGAAAKHIVGSRASNPPELLGVESGRLRGAVSASTEVREADGQIEGIVGAGGVVYAAIHELGGEAGKDHQVTIPARPYMGPGLKESTPAILELLGEAFTGTVVFGG